MNEKKLPENVKGMVESIIGCKWSLAVLEMVRQGIHRPGAMTRHQMGLTTKVLNERLRKLARFGILEKDVFPEVPPRVEYRFTPFGEKFLSIVDVINHLEAELAHEQRAQALTDT